MTIRELKAADAEYPQRALELPGRHRVIRVLGDLELLQAGPILAVVGTRTPEPDVTEATGRIAWIGDQLEFTPRFLFSPDDHRVARDGNRAAERVTDPGVAGLKIRLLRDGIDRHRVGRSAFIHFDRNAVGP